MIELRNVSKIYQMGSEPVAALRGVTLDIRRGEFVAIMGASGSGKSTLMHILGLLDVPDEGRYRLDGKEATDLDDNALADLRGRMVGFVFQQFHLLARTTARENVLMPQLYAAGRAGPARARGLLHAVGLGARMEHRPNELSGGQQQRVAIARALVNGPEIILADEPTGNLDSRSAEEIMRLLAQLHQQGKTVILVTHEPELAEYAARTITLRDGVVLSDVSRAPRAAPAPDPELAALMDAPAPKPHRWAIALLRLPGLLRQALRTVAANKVRSGLSMLGILIGVAAVIAMMALGAGARAAIQQQLASLGSNTLMLSPGAPQVGGVRQQEGTSSRLRLEDAADMPRELPLVARAAPLVTGRARAVFGDKNWNTSVSGTTPDYGEIANFKTQVGRFFTEQDVTARERVAVIGTTLVRELFGGRNPIGEYIKLNRINFQVVGVLAQKGATGFRDQDDVVIVPVTTAMYRLFGHRYLDVIMVEAVSSAALADAPDVIQRWMLRRNRMDPKTEDAFSIRSLSEIRDMLAATSKTMSTLLASIAVISLIVGGIGIMNIMLVSVTERTREIGLRKAVGAHQSDVLIQFLIEAVTVSVTGGLLGILLGWGAAAAMSRWASWTVVVSPASIVIAFLSSSVVGVVFGLWPARKASLLNPIDALRYE